MPRILQARQHGHPQRIPVQRHPVRRLRAIARRAAARRQQTTMPVVREIRRLPRLTATPPVGQRQGDRPRIRLPEPSHRLRDQKRQGLRRPLRRRQLLYPAHAHDQIRHQKLGRARRLLAVHAAGRRHQGRNRRQARHHRHQRRQQLRRRQHRQRRHRQGTQQHRQLQRRPRPHHPEQDQPRRQQHRPQPRRRRHHHDHRMLRQQHAMEDRGHRQAARHRRPPIHRVRRRPPTHPSTGHRTVQRHLRDRRRPHRQRRQGKRRQGPTRHLPRVRHHQGQQDIDGELHQDRRIPGPYQSHRQLVEICRGLHPVQRRAHPHRHRSHQRHRPMRRRIRQPASIPGPPTGAALRRPRERGCLRRLRREPHERPRESQVEHRGPHIRSILSNTIIAPQLPSTPASERASHGPAENQTEHPASRPEPIQHRRTPA